MKKQELTVRERIEAAVQLRRHDDPAMPLSVSAVCKDAGVSRANLYAHYPDVLKAIRATWTDRKSRPSPAGNVKPPDESSPHIDKALLYLCLELRAEVEALRKRAAGTPPRVKSRTAKP